MFKRLGKSLFKGIIKLNIFTVSLGIFNYTCLDHIVKYLNQSEIAKHREKLAEHNITYEFYKNKFLEKINNNDNRNKNDEIYESIDSRSEQIKKLETENFDVLIIGGGSAGAGVLLDAYTRGLKCGLIESFDFASGTSSRSSKLIHGGLRYLEQVFTFDLHVGLYERFKQFELVKEALGERNFVSTSAVFMNKSLELIISANNYLSLLYYYNGVFMYSFLYLINDLKKGGNGRLNFFFEPMKLDIGNKNILLYEGQMNDSRQNILSILSCCINNYLPNRDSSIAANYVEFKNFIYNKNREIIAVKAFDKINKKEFIIKAKTFVNCTGIYCDDNLADNDQMKHNMIKASKGSHLIFKDLNLTQSIMIPKTSDGRVLFVFPYNNYFLAGTTDETQEKSFYPSVLEKEENFIINEMLNFSKELFVSEEYLRSKISSKWSGYRPLVCETGFNNNNNSSKSLSRSHVIRYEPQSKLYSLMGGKWTTYRNMGKELVDKILENELDLKEKIIPNANSKYFKLKGSYNRYKENYSYEDFTIEKLFYKDIRKKLSQEFSFLNKIQIKGLIRRQGINAIKILVEGQKSGTNKILFGDILESEIRYTIKNEMAIKPNDIICRRLGLGFIDDKISLEAIPIISKILGEELKLSKSEISQMQEEAIKNFTNKI